MPTYDYKCSNCGNIERIIDSCDGPTKTRLDQNDTPCTCSPDARYRRVFGFGLIPVMQEHYNHAAGQNISSMRQMRDVLKRSEEKLVERDGIPRDLQPIDHEELVRLAADKLGDDGLKEQHDGRVARGEIEPVSRGRMVAF